MRFCLCLILTLSLSTARADSCYELFEKSSLPSTSRQSLLRAIQNKFIVGEFQKEVGGRLRTIVLVSYPMIPSGAVVKNLQENFPYEGYEQFFEDTTTWGGKIFEKFWFFLLPRKIRNLLYRSLSLKIDTEQQRKRSADVEKELRDLRKELAGVTGKEYPETKSVSAELQEVMQSLRDHVIPSFNLGKNHKPNIKENISSVIWYWILATPFISYVLGLYSYDLQQAYIGVVGYFAIGELLANLPNALPNVEKLFPIAFAYRSSRSDTIVQNLITTLESHPDVESILVTVDRRYFEWMRERLSEKGFSTIPLEEEP